MQRSTSLILTTHTGSLPRPGDLVARYHRDEFALVLASTDGPGAFNISDHVRQCIEQLQLPSAKDAPSQVVTSQPPAAATASRVKPARSGHSSRPAPCEAK